MTQPLHSSTSSHKTFSLGVWTIFLTEFVSVLLINGRNIAQPGMISELNGMSLFSWLIALPALAGSTSTLLFGKLSDIYGRRKLLLISIAIFILGLGITTFSKSMAALVAAATFMSIGHFPIVPLCFTAIGDLFEPAERAKWTGLLNLPAGIAALIGPVLGGIASESIFGWRALYWGTIPLMLIGGILVAVGLPDTREEARPKIDLPGTLVMVLATGSVIIGISFLGDPAKLLPGIVLLAGSLFAWFSFIKIEHHAAAPILDPQVFRSRTFMTAAVAAFLSYFAFLAILSYSPIFVQDVMKVSPTVSGSMLTPYTLIASFLGIPTGLLLARTRRYKWMYNAGHLIVTAAMVAMWRFTAATPIWLYILVTSIAAIGLGMIPTIHTLVAQFAMPRRLLGVAVAAIYFFQMAGIAVAPSLLGLIQKSAVNLESGLKLIFLAAAIAMALATLIISTIPEIPLDAEKSE